MGKIFSDRDYKGLFLSDIAKLEVSNRGEAYFSPLEEASIRILAKKGLNLVPLLNQAVADPTEYIVCSSKGSHEGAVWNPEAGQLVVDTPKGERIFKVGLRKH